MANKKHNVVFIGGYGRSGSTILDMLLNRVDGFVATGELRHIFGRALTDNELCSCSKKFRDCPYWKSVVDNSFSDDIDIKTHDIYMKQINTLRNYFKIIDYDNNKSHIGNPAYEYIKDFENIYQAILSKSKSNIVIDSSKYPMHGLAMSKSNKINLKVILLVRDPRAVAYSWEKKKLRPEVHWETRYMPRHNFIRSALAWNLSNSLVKKIPTEDFYLLKYEDFIDKPIEKLNDVAKFMTGKNLKINESIYNPDSSKPDHTIAGNPIRLASKKYTVVKDDGWISKMPTYKKMIIKMLCYRQMKEFGYV